MAIRRLLESDFSGKKFGRLTVLKFIGRKRYLVYVRAKCSCGKIKDIRLAHVTSGKIISCGCFKNEAAAIRSAILMRTHGKTKTRVYRIWHTMKNRCKHKTMSGWRRYVGRGIKVCQRWNRFENFFRDMGDPPTVKHTLGRIDNDGNYSPSNCRWETPEQQYSNMSTNVFVEYAGDKITVSQASRKTGISVSLIATRIRKGLPKEFVLSKYNLRNNKPLKGAII